MALIYTTLIAYNSEYLLTYFLDSLYVIENIAHSEPLLSFLY